MDLDGFEVGDAGHGIHALHELGAAVGVEHVIPAVGAVVDPAGADVHRLGDGERQQDHVAVGHHRGAEVLLAVVALGQLAAGVGERRAIDQAVNGADVHHLVRHAELAADALGHLELTGVALAVVEGEGVDVEPLAQRAVQHGVGVHAAGVDHHGGAVGRRGGSRKGHGSALVGEFVGPWVRQSGVRSGGAQCTQIDTFWPDSAAIARLSRLPIPLHAGAPLPRLPSS